MVYQGHVRNGKIELDADVRLPDGVRVTVSVLDSGSQATETEKGEETLGQRLLRHAGTAEGLPPDAAGNLDHYLYGVPKR